MNQKEQNHMTRHITDRFMDGLAAAQRNCPRVSLVNCKVAAASNMSSAFVRPGDKAPEKLSRPVRAVLHCDLNHGS